ncbi:MAG: 3-phosphoshikimate 1-carboxyvinyltransferase [Actinomycetaceae bacterium]|nr:3-phosphoshikimate 1-carboxyvinyltransferase [Actinomycetaceae bacterium]
MAHNDWWHAPLSERATNTTIHIPGSKSLTNRVLALSAFADGPSRITGALKARDTQLMIDGLQALGAHTVTASSTATTPRDTESGSQLIVTPVGSAIDPNNGGNTAMKTSSAQQPQQPTIACGLAGTVMRFLPAYAALKDTPVTFSADDQAQSRPLKPLLQALESMGATVSYAGSDIFPFTICGPIDAREITLDSSGSSQFATALLLIAPLIHSSGTFTVRLVGDIPSRPHIDMTIQCLRERGITIEEPDKRTFIVHCAPISALDTVIEPDLSNAGPFLAAALVTGGTVRIPHWPKHTTQAGDAWREILRDMGAHITLNTSLTVSAGQRIAGIHRDFSSEGELVPTAAALAVCADSPSVFTGIGHLRGHETDRLTALATEIAKLGVRVDEGADYLRIDPTGSWRQNLPPRIEFESYHDHRMATFAAIIGLAVPGVLVRNIETTSKTLPDFTQMWKQVCDTSAAASTVFSEDVDE